MKVSREGFLFYIIVIISILTPALQNIQQRIKNRINCKASNIENLIFLMLFFLFFFAIALKFLKLKKTNPIALKLHGKYSSLIDINGVKVETVNDFSFMSPSFSNS